MKDSSGKLITKHEDQMERWKEYFSTLLNQTAPLQRPNISPASNSLSINCEHPSREEIRKATKALWNGKAAGPDNIPPEAIKATEVKSTEMVYRLFKAIWTTEEVPSLWKEGYIIKIPKKGISRNARTIEE